MENPPLVGLKITDSWAPSEFRDFHYASKQLFQVLCIVYYQSSYVVHFHYVLLQVVVSLLHTLSLAPLVVSMPFFRNVGWFEPWLQHSHVWDMSGDFPLGWDQNWVGERGAGVGVGCCRGRFNPPQHQSGSKQARLVIRG